MSFTAISISLNQCAPGTLVLTSVRWTCFLLFPVPVYTCWIDEGELVFWR